MMYGAVTGMFETEKHKSALQCAQCELEEEVHLKTETWIPLLQTPDTSIPFDKYCDNR